ncbi:jasmonoyl--L-amino acid synthetase JAR1-like [Pollicipes pollicipes]|uniref:jasmonoyl--L-amino acid synthetase JAR1-like n=1 Tax=Pollicipes pollicipes TaxID=41117 RepID=UPI001884F2B1|nr:jasmonoyl--L-amino acid synthetase JAR1-like [Pollicipes pollicipes]
MHEQQADLVADLRRGRLKDDLAIPAAVRAQLETQLKPLPARADEVQRAFAGGPTGLLPRLWPELRFVMGAFAGLTNAAYHREMALYAGNVPVIAQVYGCSELGLVAAITDFRHPERPVYTLLPKAAFFEFLPVVGDRIQELAEIGRQEPLLADQLQEGGEYELIVTTRGGLCRYRLGDVVRFVGYFNRTPQVEILYRAGFILNASDEMVSEKVFFEALADALALWPADVHLVDYTVAPSQLLPLSEHQLAPHFHLFVELDGPLLSDEQTKLLPAGAFRRFRDHLLATTTASPTQFKMPRVLRTAEAAEWLLKCHL